MTSPNRRFDVDVSEETYLVHETGPLSARIHKPHGKGPFPAVVDVHGGGWCVGTNRNNDKINHELATRGIVVASVDFRMPPVARYPDSVADINFAVRWLKTQASALGSEPALVGTIGSSSGGHLTVLSDIKPTDPRYLAIHRDGIGTDASVAFAVALWPVICPLGRYRYLQTVPKSDKHAVFSEGIARHDNFWGTPEAMAEGSPVHAMQRGDAIALPRLLYVQNEKDELHPRADLDRFVELYRKCGGNVALELYQGPAYDFIRVEPQSAEGQRVMTLIADFIWDSARAT